MGASTFLVSNRCANVHICIPNELPTINTFGKSIDDSFTECQMCIDDHPGPKRFRFKTDVLDLLYFQLSV